MTKYLSRTLIVVLQVFLKMPLRADSIPEIVRQKIAYTTINARAAVTQLEQFLFEEACRLEQAAVLTARAG
jgi:hypothetical protein